MDGQLISSNEYKTTKWSGGKTTQFFLYPTGSEFNIGEFDLRVSSATIESKTSTFTDLRGYNRIIMTLDNPIFIQHNDCEKILLQPFEKHYFSGDDTTVSYGECTDFNVIFKKGMDADASVVTNGMVKLLKNKQYIIYFIENTIVTNEIGEKYSVNKGECLYIKNECKTLDLEAFKESKHNCVAIIIKF